MGNEYSAEHRGDEGFDVGAGRHASSPLRGRAAPRKGRAADQKQRFSPQRPSRDRTQSPSPSPNGSLSRTSSRSPNLEPVQYQNFTRIFFELLEDGNAYFPAQTTRKTTNLGDLPTIEEDYQGDVHAAFTEKVHRLGRAHESEVHELHMKMADLNRDLTAERGMREQAESRATSYLNTPSSERHVAALQALREENEGREQRFQRALDRKHELFVAENKALIAEVEDLRREKATSEEDSASLRQELSQIQELRLDTFDDNDSLSMSSNIIFSPGPDTKSLDQHALTPSNAHHEATIRGLRTRLAHCERSLQEQQTDAARESGEQARLHIIELRTVHRQEKTNAIVRAAARRMLSGTLRRAWTFWCSKVTARRSSGMDGEGLNKVRRRERIDALVRSASRRTLAGALRKAWSMWYLNFLDRHVENSSDDGRAEELRELQDTVAHLRGVINDLRNQHQGVIEEIEAGVGSPTSPLSPMMPPPPNVSPASSTSSHSTPSSPVRMRNIILNALSDPVVQARELLTFIKSSPNSSTALNWDSCRSLNIWDGIEVDFRGSVTAIDISGKLSEGAEGPEEEFTLDVLGSVLSPSMAHVRLHENYCITGDIAIFSQCRWLIEVNLRRTQVHGSVAVFTGCPGLEILDLRESCVTGLVQDLCSGRCPSLKSLLLNYTAIGGEITPAECAWISSRRESLGTQAINLWASGGMKLSVNRPWVDRGPLEGINCIDLSEMNTLSGDISSFVDFAGKVTKLTLEDCPSMSGDIATLVPKLSSIINLNLTRSKVAGDVAIFRNACMNLRQLLLASTEITGNVAVFEHRSLLRSLDLSDCRGLNGNFNAFRECTSLKELYLSGVHLDGDVDELRRVHRSALVY